MNRSDSIINNKDSTAGKMLDLYTDYLICQNGLATATGLSKLMSGEVSHDKVTRLLNNSEFTSKDLWHYVKKDVRKAENIDDGVLILDDSIEEKPYTDENDIICWHFSHVKGANVKGINLLSCLVRYGDLSFPIGYEMVHKTSEYKDEKSGKLRRKSEVTKNEYFRNLVNHAYKNEIKFKYVLADTWFSSKENLEFIQRKKRLFIIGIKSNRTVALTEKDKLSGKFKQVKSLNIKEDKSVKVWLKGIDFPLNLIKKVFKNENGTDDVLYLVTNDTNGDADYIYSIYQKRWDIEVYHKSIKQNSSLAKSPTKVVRSQSNHVFASIVGYCKLQALRVNHAMNHFALKYKLVVKANQAAMQELLRLRKMGSA
jgi:hypothetical protein